MPLAERVRNLPFWAPLASRNFRLLWIGQFVSIFGDQFYLVALPWLVLHLTGSGLDLGVVLMLGGTSRALFQLVGGAVSDRLPSRVVMLFSNVARALITATITLIIWLGITKLWHLYFLAVLFGMVDAFFYPAYMATVPTLVIKDQLVAGNSLLRSTNELMRMVGPAVAGVLVEALSITTAFGIDTTTFIFAAITIWLMKSRRSAPEAEVAAPEADEPKPGLLLSIRQGIGYAWRDPMIRRLIVFIATIEFAFAGPYAVGLPSLAKNRFPGGASSLGIMLSSLAAGMLAGMVVAGAVSLERWRGKLIVIVAVTLSACLCLMGFVPNVIAACVLMAVIGLGCGAVNIVILSWLQARTRPGMLGRVMSLVMFSVVVLEPISFAFAGWLSDISLPLLFTSGGGLTLAATVYYRFSPVFHDTGAVEDSNVSAIGQ